MQHETQPHPGSARRRRGTRGQALVEFALVLPIFVTLVAGTLDLGYGLYSRMTIINAAREGARAAVMAANPTNASTTATTAVTNAANGLTPTPTTVTCSHSGATVACSAAQPGDAVDVTVQYTYQTFFPFLFGAQLNMDAHVRMVFE